MRRFWARLFGSFRRPIDCGDVRDLSSEYVGESLPTTLTSRFRHHLSACQDCNFFVATFRATVLSLRGLPAREAPRDLEERILALLHDEQRGQDEQGYPQAGQT